MSPRAMVEPMVSYAGIALGTFVAALIRTGYKHVTGKEMFPANPKGPLYKWLGGANHGSSSQLDRHQHGQEQERLSAPLDRPPVRLLPASKRRP